MSITDELREWAHGFNGPWRRNEEMLLAIADRIDEKHERTFRNLTDALHKQEDATRELAEKSVLLPVDADGEVIHIGDRVENKEHVISHATFEITPHIDWSRMADELDEFAEIVRGMAGDAE